MIDEKGQTLPVHLIGSRADRPFQREREGWEGGSGMERERERAKERRESESEMERGGE